jgi:hypothetical protein
MPKRISPACSRKASILRLRYKHRSTKRCEARCLLACPVNTQRHKKEARRMRKSGRRPHLCTGGVYLLMPSTLLSAIPGKQPRLRGRRRRREWKDGLVGGLRPPALPRSCSHHQQPDEERCSSARERKAEVDDQRVEMGG